MLNSWFTLHNQEYWRVEDIDRMERDEAKGLLTALKHITSFDIAVNKRAMDLTAMRSLIDHLNKWEAPAT